MKEKSIWSDFTNQYFLSKTLRFELKPVGNTQKMLDDNKVFLKDKLIEDKYNQTKPYFDRLHREFVSEALITFELEELEDYQTALCDFKK